MTPTTEEPQIKTEPKANSVIDTAAGSKTDAKEDLQPNEQPKSKDDLKSIPMADLQAKLQSSPKGLTQAEAAKRLAQNGPNALKEVKVNAFLKFLTYFWGPIPWMIEAAVILSGVVRHWLDFIIISVLLLSNAVVGFWEEHQAGNAIAALKAKLANDARALRDGKWATPKASELVTGDVIRLRLGDIVPADARLLDGDPVEVDQSALTGESLPVSRKPGDAVFSGSILRQGEIDAMVYATGENTYFGKTAQLVEQAQTVSHFQRAVLKIGDYLIVLAVVLVAVILTVSLFRHNPILDTLEFCLVLLVAAIPVAMPTVLSVTMAVGARLLAKKEAIVTRLSAIEELAGVDVLCSDKTGTLTQNKLTLGDPFTVNNIAADQVILWAALASRAEDKDTIDLAVIGGVKDDKAIAGFQVLHFQPFDPVHKRTEATVKGGDGNVSFAKLQMLGDLKFSDSIYGVGAGIFFLGYFAFEIPSNIILHKVGARVWICRVIVTWGTISALTALVRTPMQFYTARLLLGVAEAGFFPGMILYLTYWFPAHRRAAMVALLMAGNPVSGIIGGPLSGFILRHFAGSKGMAGWQWLFVLEAIPAILLGVVIFFFLDNRVVEANWLSERERAAVASEIHQEAVFKTHISIRSVFTSPRVWLFGAIFFGMEMGSYAIGFWQPTVIRQTGVTDTFHIGMLTTVPYTCALICMMFVGRHSDRTRERRWHVIVPNIVAAIGFILCTQAGSNTPIAMFGLVLAVAGVITGLAMFWALPTSFLGGDAAAAGIALINCTGNLGGFFSPAIIGFLKTYTGTLNSGLFLVAACMVASSVLILTLTPAKSPTFQPTGAEI